MLNSPVSIFYIFAVSSSMAIQALSLYRELLRTGRKFSSYNIRHYIIRRTKEEFRKAKDWSDNEQILAALEEGKKQLEVAKRQRVVYSLFSPPVKSVMDL